MRKQRIELRDVIAGAVVLICGSGCQVPALRLAGITEPGARYKQNADGSRELWVSSDFEGSLDLIKNAETGEIELHVTAKSIASEPTRAQGERADHLVELRRVEAETIRGWQELLAPVVAAATALMQPAPVPGP